MTLTASGVFFSFFEHHQRSLSQIGAIAATAGDFWLAVRVLTDKFTLGFRTVGFSAFPVTSRVFANSFAFRFRSLKYYFGPENKIMKEWLLDSGLHSEVVCKLLHI